MRDMRSEATVHLVTPYLPTYMHTKHAQFFQLSATSVVAVCRPSLCSLTIVAGDYLPTAGDLRQ